MGKKTILVVEDEAPLLALLKEILESAGYRVFTASDGLEARDVYRREHEAIDLVLSDMALPKFGGWTVYLMLKEINPRVKVILTSGYLDPQVKRDMVRGARRISSRSRTSPRPCSRASKRRSAEAFAARRSRKETSIPRSIFFWSFSRTQESRNFELLSFVALKAWTSASAGVTK